RACAAGPPRPAGGRRRPPQHRADGGRVGEHWPCEASEARTQVEPEEGAVERKGNRPHERRTPRDGKERDGIGDVGEEERHETGEEEADLEQEVADRGERESACREPPEGARRAEAGPGGGGEGRAGPRGQP